MTDDSALEAAALPLADYRSLAAAFPNRAVSLPGKRLGEIIRRLDAAESRLAAAPPGDTREVEQLRAEIARMKATCHHSSQEQIGDGQLRCDLCGAIEQDPFWRNPA